MLRTCSFTRFSSVYLVTGGTTKGGSAAVSKQGPEPVWSSVSFIGIDYTRLATSSLPVPCWLSLSTVLH